jgi:predicted HTH transcriptional regulator
VLALSSLCIIFAVFSTRFLERIFGSRLKDEGKYGEEVHQKENQPDRTEENVVKAIRVSNPDKARTMENQSKILRALASAEDAKLTLADLMRNIEISQKDFDETLSLLMAKGTVAQVLSGGN